MEREGVVSSSKERSIRTKCTIPGKEKEKVGGVKAVWVSSGGKNHNCSRC